MQSPTDQTIYAQVVPSGSPMIVAGALKHTSVSKSSNFPTPKSSPMKRNPSASGQEASSSRIAEERWIDGPKVSKYRVAEARHLMREINHLKNYETWIDGPNTKVNPQIANAIGQSGTAAGYGFMDSHKKKMIRQWVENQTCQILHQIETVSTNPVQYHTYYKSQSQNQQQQTKSDIVVPKNEDDHSSIGSKNDEFVNPLSLGLNLPTTVNANYSESSIKTGLKQLVTNEFDQDINSEKSASNISENRQLFTSTAAVGCSADMEEEDQDSGPSEVPPALPLIEPLGSREVSRHVSRESLCQNIMMMDCALQVTEDDIARAMGG